jgi:hypothetical protein
VARYRAGAFEQCLEALEKSMKLQSGGGAHDWFFVAMAHAKLGHPRPIARSYFDKAVDWTKEHAADNEELKRIRTEAETFLGIGAQAQ